jgi:hemerythrin superfamily protein
MATRTRARNGSKASDKSSGISSSKERSAFRWGGRQTGMVAAAAVAGAAVGLAANLGRKLVVQGLTSQGDWDEALAAEHRLTLAVFDKLEATDNDQTMARTHLLHHLKHMLTKHAAEEENAVYPALREADDAHDADALNAEHGYVKTFLYELENMAKDSPSWLARLRDFRTMLEEHIRMEEDEVFPRLKAGMTQEQNAKLTAAVNKEGFAVA